VTSREDGALLRRLARVGKTLHLEVESRFYGARSANVAGLLEGTRWPEEHLVLGGHHDTVYGSPGGNDNASGTIAVLETARVLAQLRAQMGVAPGRTIRFVTYGAEEQGFRGAFADVERHYGGAVRPRLAINLDELSTGHFKGLVLAFPHLRALVQGQLDALGDGLQCHVMSQLDPTSDHYPYLRAGIDAAHAWRWRFYGRHADCEYHHERGDSADKVNVRELKEYVGQMARLLLRLSHVPPEGWPENPVTRGQVEARLEKERGSVVRVF
jgi:acetylornithine deacetylase/succinyl-diaminopimelate desuccinylase-like protein